MLDAASAFRTWSADQRWRFVNEACIIDLLDKKVRYVCARDEPRAPVARIDKHAIRACALPVAQDGRSNNCPIEPASSYDPLLCVLVGVNTPKEQAESTVIQESSTAPAVAGPEAGDTN